MSGSATEDWDYVGNSLTVDGNNGITWLPDGERAAFRPKPLFVRTHIEDAALPSWRDGRKKTNFFQIACKKSALKQTYFM